MKKVANQVASRQGEKNKLEHRLHIYLHNFDKNKFAMDNSVINWSGLIQVLLEEYGSNKTLKNKINKKLREY